MFDIVKNSCYNMAMKMDIALGILFTILSKKELVSANELSAKYTVCTRTIYRYVNFLDMSGIPIITKTGKSGGIGIINKFELKNMYFSNIELLNLINACSSIDNVTVRTNLQTKLLYLLHKDN